MIQISETEVSGWKTAIRGMRAPKQSWDRIDSFFNVGVLGENDLKLASTLAKAGTDHGKFLRMINVGCKITAPAYWTTELDTYKVGTVRDSCSLQHTGAKKEFTAEDFSFYSNIDNKVITALLNEVNRLREKYNETKDYNDFLAMRQLLPMGYNYTFYWTSNYAVLRNIYSSRKNHRIPEWKDFCAWIETLPYANELIVS